MVTPLLSTAGLLLAVARDPMLGAIAVGGFAVALAFFALLAWLSVWLLRRAVPEARAPRWRDPAPSCGCRACCDGEWEWRAIRSSRNC